MFERRRRKKMDGILLLFTSLIVFYSLFSSSQRCTCSTVSYCYYGNIKNQNYFMNESCTTGEKHFTNVQSSKKTNVAQNISHITSSSHVTHCLIFKYLVKKTLKDETNVLTIDTSVYANFSCDYDGICANQVTGRINNITYRGLQGDLFCCDKDNCNSRHTTMQDLPPYQQLCYTGSNISTVPTGLLSYCKHPDDMCARTMATLKDGRVVESYFCDSVYCKKNNMTKSLSETCKTVTIDNVSSKLCCCWTNKCMKPSWPLTHVTEESTTASSFTLAENWVVTGIVIGMSVLIGVFLGALATVAVYRHRKKKMERLTMTYHRIAADDPVHGENVQMIV